MSDSIVIHEEEFINYIFDNTKNEPIIILGGHYLLLYNDVENILEPAILEENKHEHLVEMSKVMAGNFPYRSFKLSLELKKLKNDHTKVALLVNDHYFQSTSFNILSGNKLNGNWGQFRTSYYLNNSVPKCYVDLIEHFNFSVDDILLNNPLSKKSVNYHPYIFSETSLRKKFDRDFKKKLSELDNFRLQTQNGKKSDLFYLGGINHSTCITQDGACGCSGEVMQFIKEAWQLPYKVLLMMVPLECYESVCLGVEAFVGYKKNNMDKEHFSFIVASGFGDQDYDKIWNEQSIQLRQFNL